MALDALLFPLAFPCFYVRDGLLHVFSVQIQQISDQNERVVLQKLLIELCGFSFHVRDNFVHLFFFLRLRWFKNQLIPRSMPFQLYLQKRVIWSGLAFPFSTWKCFCGVFTVSTAPRSAEKDLFWNLWFVVFNMSNAEALRWPSICRFIDTFYLSSVITLLPNAQLSDAHSHTHTVSMYSSSSMSFFFVAAQQFWAFVLKWVRLECTAALREIFCICAPFYCPSSPPPFFFPLCTFFFFFSFRRWFPKSDSSLLQQQRK